MNLIAGMANAQTWGPKNKCFLGLWLEYSHLYGHIFG